MSRSCVDPAGLATVLAGLSYPARTWQLLAQADHYGAGGQIRAHLSRLPPNRAYPSLEVVIATLDALAPAPPSTPQPG